MGKTQKFTDRNVNAFRSPYCLRQRGARSVPPKRTLCARPQTLDPKWKRIGGQAKAEPTRDSSLRDKRHHEGLRHVWKRSRRGRVQSGSDKRLTDRRRRGFESWSLERSRVAERVGCILFLCCYACPALRASNTSTTTVIPVTPRMTATKAPPSPPLCPIAM